MLSKADTHVHTYYSGYTKYGILKFPESVETPEMQVENSRRCGMNTLCVTDHDAVRGAFIAKEYAKKYDDFTVIIGEEITTADGEVLAYDLNELIPPMLSIEETMDRIRSQDALAVAPHPFSFYVPCLKDRIFDLDLDGIEAINGGHVDPYTNHHAQKVLSENPGRWAPMSGSDAHSRYTMGYNWTEYEGSGEEDFRKALKNKTTKPCGVPAPVFTQVQWSVQVTIGAQKLMIQSLRRKLEPIPENPLIDKVLKISDLKRVAGLIGGAMYVMPPMPFMGAIAATTWLKRQANDLLKKE